MSNEHVGMYIRLLCLQHQKGALTEKEMTYICSTYVEDVYCKFTKGENNTYCNERLSHESNKRKKYSESRRKNINNRYKSLKAKEISTSTYVVHMENENENENIDRIEYVNNKEISIKDNIYTSDFLQFWNEYPNKKCKKKAYESWLKYKPDIFIVLKSLSWQNKTDDWIKENGKYVPMASTYVNNKRWEDEPKQKQTTFGNGVII